MNDITPVGRITSMLLEAGYRSVSAPLVIGGLKFDFPAALVGTDPSPDLILIADTIITRFIATMGPADFRRRRLPVAWGVGFHPRRRISQVTDLTFDVICSFGTSSSGTNLYPVPASP